MPEVIRGLTPHKIVWVSGGREFSTAVSDKGYVYSWGCGEDGQLGQGSIASRRSPAAVRGLPNVKKVCCGSRHVLALTDRGVYVWGWILEGVFSRSGRWIRI